MLSLSPRDIQNASFIRVSATNAAYDYDTNSIVKAAEILDAQDHLVARIAVSDRTLSGYLPLTSNTPPSMTSLLVCAIDAQHMLSFSKGQYHLSSAPINATFVMPGDALKLDSNHRVIAHQAASEQVSTKTKDTGLGGQSLFSCDSLKLKLKPPASNVLYIQQQLHLANLIDGKTDTMLASLTVDSHVIDASYDNISIKQAPSGVPTQGQVAFILRSQHALGLVDDANQLVLASGITTLEQVKLGQMVSVSQGKVTVCDTQIYKPASRDYDCSRPRTESGLNNVAQNVQRRNASNTAITKSPKPFSR